MDEEESEANMGKVGIAVVGAGYWGPNLVRNFVADEGCEVRWVCDLDKDRAAKLAGRYGITGVTDDLAEVLADPQVQGVAIATPAQTHAGIAEACIAAGKDLLIEKPLAADVKTGRAIVEKADNAGTIVMTDHTFCYTSTVAKIRDLVQSGDIGDFGYYDSVRVNLGLVQADVDVVWDLAPHDFSIIDFITPDRVRPVSVSAVGSDPLGVGHACVAYVTIRMSNGAIAHVHLNWLSPVKIRTVIIGGSEKMLMWDDTKPAQRLSIYESGAQIGDLSERERREVLVQYRSGDMVAPAIAEKEALAEVVSEFRQCIESRRKPATDGWAGLRVLEMLDAASVSLRTGGAPVFL